MAQQRKLLIAIAIIVLISVVTINYAQNRCHTTRSQSTTRGQPKTKGQPTTGVQPTIVFQNSQSENSIQIAEMINGIPQNDSRIVRYIQKNYLVAPSNLPYNITVSDDPGNYHGITPIIKRILQNMRNGYFVDAGAHDGQFLSNTLFLERDFGWTGLLVEPSPVELPNLFNVHRKAWIATVCVSPNIIPSKLDFLHRVNYTIASKLAQGAQDDKTWPNNWKRLSLPCFPFFSLLSAVGVYSIDYFSLDVEGVELLVLKTIPFDSVFIKVFSIEYNLIPEGQQALIDFMSSKNYTCVAEAYHDYIFVHKSLNYESKKEACIVKH